MNDMNQLEKLLVSWTPRRPSARLEPRLFAAGPAAAVALPPFRFGWLAPAAAALALLCVLLNQRFGPPLSGAASPAPMVAMILSNQSAAAYLPGSFRAAQNNVPADALKWSAGARLAPGAASLSRRKESHLP